MRELGIIIFGVRRKMFLVIVGNVDKISFYGRVFLENEYWWYVIGCILLLRGWNDYRI